MAHTTLIWDHHTVRIWRTSRSGARLIQEGEAQDVTALLLLLDRAEETLQIGRLRVYLDIPALDHHLERVPKMAPKLQQQLLEQRKLKLYGTEERSSAASEMGLHGEAAHQFYIVSSLPHEIPSAIAHWALRNGVLLVGVFSLPYVLSCFDSTMIETDAEGVIHYRGLGDAGYLIARDSAGKLLFFSRLTAQDLGTEQMNSIARRLGLFVEQEFGANPQFQGHDATESSDDAATVSLLSKLKLGASLDLVPRGQRTRQRIVQFKHRAFACLCITLILGVYQTIPQINKKQELELDLSELNVSIQEETLEINQVRRSILENRQYENVIQFSRGRETLDDDAPVPAPLLIILYAFSNALPESVELDTYSGSIDTTEGVTTVEMVGRPLTADLDLPAEIKVMFGRLKKQGWQLSEPKVAFEQANSRSRFGDARGRLRKFTISFTVKASTQPGGIS
jgi:HSP20 family molecular chaperone IbpA